MLCRCIDSVAGPDFVTGHGRHIDDMSGSLPLHVWQCRAMPYCTPLIFASIIRFQSSIFRRSSGELGINPELLIMTRCLVVLRGICGCWDSLAAVRAQPLNGEKAGGCLAQPATCARDDDDLSFDCSAHIPDSI